DRVDLIGVAHVGRDERRGAATCRGERLGLGAAADHDVGTGVEEALRDAPADAATATGHDHDLAGEVEWIARHGRTLPDGPSDASGSLAAERAVVHVGEGEPGAPRRASEANKVIRSEVRDHVAEVVIDNPPVNALPIAGWQELARTIAEHGRDPDVHVLILAANTELKGFQVGVDIKELAADPTKRSLVRVSR